VSTVRQARVCYCSGVAPTISKHLVYTLSNNRRLHQSTCKSVIMYGTLPERFFWESNSTVQTENNIQI